MLGMLLPMHEDHNDSLDINLPNVFYTEMHFVDIGYSTNVFSISLYKENNQI